MYAKVVITLRADFYDRPLHYPAFGELVRKRMETIWPLSAEELEAAIERPAARVGMSFEPGLVTVMITEVHDQAGALPLLQYALTELFEQREGRKLTHVAYRKLGGATGALAKRANDLFNEYDSIGREAIRQTFLRLVTVGDDIEDTRRRVQRSELLSLATDEDLADEIIDTFSVYRLLTLDHDPITRCPTVEVAHEAILHEWQRLHTWLDETRDDIRMQHRLAACVQEWLNAGKDPGFLLTGTRLEQFYAWSTGTIIRRSEMDAMPLTVAFGPGDTTALAGYIDGTVILWDLETGERRRTFIGHESWVGKVDISPDGDYAISIDNEGVIILWNITTRAEIRRFYSGHQSWSMVAFGPDGQTAYSVSSGNTEMIQWQITAQSLPELLAWVQDNRYIRDFTCEERQEYHIKPLCE